MDTKNIKKLNIQDGDLILIGNLDNSGMASMFSDDDIEILNATLHKLYPNKKFGVLTNFSREQIDGIRYLHLQDNDVVICPDYEVLSKFMNIKLPVRNVSLIVSDKEIRVKGKEGR